MLKFLKQNQNKDEKTKKAQTSPRAAASTAVETVQEEENFEIPDDKPQNIDYGRLFDVRANFGFPFEGAYSVQTELMSKIYSVLQDSSVQIGLFSSPTGTGKSLSLICSVLSFYLDPNI